MAPILSQKKTKPIEVNVRTEEEMLIRNYIKKYGKGKFAALGGLADKIREYGMENFYAYCERLPSNGCGFWLYANAACLAFV